MAAGDMRMKIDKFSVILNEQVIVEFRYGIEDKRGSIDSRGDTTVMPWAQFTALLTAGERSALASVRDKMLQYVKSMDITRFGSSLDLT